MSKAMNEQTKQLAFRLTHTEVAWLESEAARLSAETMLDVTLTGVVRRLIALAMKGSPTGVAPAPKVDSRQLAIPGAVVPVVVAAPPTNVVELKTAKTPRATPPRTDAALKERVLAAARAAVKAGTKQSEIWKPAGVGQGAFSEFLKNGTRVGDDKLRAIAKVLKVPT